jgi:hypothetical protein
MSENAGVASDATGNVGATASASAASNAGVGPVAGT